MESNLIYLCPHCGQSLSRALDDGFTSCSHCNRVFDSSPMNRLLAAWWVLHNNTHLGLEQLQHQSKLNEAEAILVYTFAMEHCYSVQEFHKALKSLGISDKVYLDEILKKE